MMLSPLAVPLAYRWPVTEIGPGQVPLDPPETPTTLLVHRDASGDVRFTRIAPLVHRLLESIGAHARAGREHLAALAREIGANVFAVEIHQQSTGSSDVSFDFELVGQPPPPQVRLAIAKFVDGVVVYWTDGTYVLESSTEPRSPAWEPITGASPVSISLPAGDDARFFRLRK